MDPTEDDPLRPGEAVADIPPAADAALRFIGQVRTPWTRREDCPRRGDAENGPVCQLLVAPPWRRALTGLERFEAADVLYWLHRARRDLILQSPRRDGKTTGTFSVRSPLRPNPIGLARVRIVAVEDDAVLVRGLDCLDGTPLLDIKPAHCMFSGPTADRPAP